MLLGGALPGCRIYQHTVEPLDVDAGGMLLGTDRGRSSTHLIEPNSYMSLKWGNRGIGHIARAYDFITVDHADLEIINVMGIWTGRFVHIYGTRRVPVESVEDGADGGAPQGAAGAQAEAAGEGADADAQVDVDDADADDADADDADVGDADVGDAGTDTAPPGGR